jgi:excisionase family DNA binding protein
MQVSLSPAPNCQLLRRLSATHFRPGVTAIAGQGGKIVALALNFPTDEVFLTTEEVLEYLQVNLRTVYRLIKAGKIPAVRVGRQWRFRKRDIDAWLDSQRPRGERPAAPAAAPVRSTRQRVLVVDDEASIRDLLSKTLALAEYDVDTAPDGTTALDRMRAYNYDLLIADLKMPGMDGLTLIRQAKRIKADLPVNIITGFSTESSAIEAVNLGVAGYLTKPFRVPQVLAAASKALGAPAA